MRERILIVEDDPAISRLIDTNLTLSGYQTVCAMDGSDSCAAVRSGTVRYYAAGAGRF